MLVSHSHRFIYLKTAKTAGTSIEAYFEPYCRPENSGPVQHHCDQHESTAGIVGYRGPNRTGKKWFNHMPASAVRRHVGEEIWSSYFKFCAVRNPWQKAISAFAFQKHKDGTSMPQPTLADRIRHPLHTSKQLLFLCWLQTGRQPIDKDIYAPDGTFFVDGIIRHECLENDMDAICQHLGLPWEVQKMDSHKMGIRPPGMTAACMVRAPADRLIRDSYQFEIDTFNYSDSHSKGEIPADLQFSSHSFSDRSPR